jgi:hypothetical protein
MKKTFVAYYLLFLTLVTVSTGLKSQDALTGIPVERLQVCTDRTMYISGEKILFSALIFKEDDKLSGDYSRILYCELITPGGNRITGGKYPVENSSSQGCIKIPEETITGMYYLKSYTRLMRNGGPTGYHYVLLKIINPYKSEIQTSNDVKDSSILTGKLPEDKQTDLKVIITLEKRSYARRENISMQADGITKTEFPSKLCLAVIPEMAGEENAIPDKMAVTSSGELQFYPETRGLSLSGRLLENETGRPFPNTKVNLSITGDKDVMAIRTDSSGRFFFALPGYSGSRDIFLCAEDIPDNSPEIYIENDFCPEPVTLPSPLFHLTKYEYETAYRMAVNQKVTSIFRPDTAAVAPETGHNSQPFYGEPTETLVVGTYIDLPTLEDYFIELVGAVKVRKSQGRKVFRFNTLRPEMTIYDPLVLIDWVAVDDIDRILAISPKDIDRIELVNSPYIKGNITYGGIISFVSKHNDYAGIDLPASGTFINYKFLEACSRDVPYGSLPANIPDSRNTIYWDPDVQTDENGSAEITFTAPDTPGKYIILLSRIGSAGESVISREKIEVVGD